MTKLISSGQDAIKLTLPDHFTSFTSLLSNSSSQTVVTPDPTLECNSDFGAGGADYDATVDEVEIEFRHNQLVQSENLSL
jgi:hypothetical protein